ncbi:MetQ/NlpA family ABC transporter substrate-binding protein [Lacticaseibacillus daqingensis]|uniref:MetQ/NlpA family ABC transporter substrate-binding protein n=1 Tax=Lacticaseibacillus daqingensis TaxID=2486014 RepID=UPI000F7B19D2|nr:MetQ/NlpA family ABC transporter substrate-binding protein [Lacticaseibacillus daqingensis]
MKLWKKLLLTAALVLPVIGLTACGQGNAEKTVKVGIMSNDKEIWEDIQSRLKKDDINIKLVEFTDYNTPNQALQDGDVDLNSFQHHVFLDTWNKKHNTKIVDLGDTYIAPIRAYSNDLKSLKDLKTGDTVALPNDAANEPRALGVLVDAGLIKLNDSKTPTVRDITENTLNLKFSELDPAQTARSLKDVAVAIVNNDIAAAAKLNPADSIAVEKINKTSEPYVNFIAARTAKDKDNKTYQKIVEAYQTDQTAKLLKKYYKGSAEPAWK